MLRRSLLAVALSMIIQLTGCDSTYLLDTRRLVGYCFHGDNSNRHAEYLIAEKKRFFRFFQMVLINIRKGLNQGARNSG